MGPTSPPVDPLVVEVFPVEPDRWIAVIDAPRGSFSTEVRTPREVAEDVRASIRGVLKVREPSFVLVDDEGAPWTPVGATAQVQRLGVRYRPGRESRWRRLVSSRFPAQGSCPVCGHDWREHLPADGECGECTYEMEHEQFGAPATTCRLLPPPTGRTTDPRRSARE